MATKAGCLRPLLIGIIVLTSFSIGGWYVLFSTGLYEPPTNEATSLFFKNAWIWDGMQDSVVLGNVWVEGDEIRCAGADCVAPDGVQVVDATGKSIMPGLIDLHVHYYAPSLENKGMSALQQLPDYVKQRPEVRKNFIRHGLTAIRCVGDITDNILQLRRQMEEGKFAGPRTYVSGGMITAPGGHPVSTWFAGNEMLIQNAAFQVASPEEAVSVVNQLAAKGVNGVKLVYSNGPDDQLPRMQDNVLTAAVSAAREKGLWVSVHLLDTEELQTVVALQVSSVEHATFVNADTSLLRQMAQQDICWVPALFRQQRDGVPLRETSERLKLFFMAGGTIGAGSDVQGDMLFGQSLLEEIALLHQEAGLTTAQALRTATLDAAQTLKIDHFCGSIKEGNKADLLLVEGYVWDSLPTRQRIQTVLLDGRIMMWNATLYE